MAQVTIRINGYAYTIGCNDGEEQHLLSMAGEVEKRIDSIKAAAGQSGEARMLVMAGLLMADDLYETRKRLAELEAAVASGDPGSAAKVNRRLGRVAKRAEEIADDLEQP
ncbi:MAG: cell division protein ZapA [Acetobacteraceae bacterium]